MGINLQRLKTLKETSQPFDYFNYPTKAKKGKNNITGLCKIQTSSNDHLIIPVFRSILKEPSSGITNGVCMRQNTPRRLSKSHQRRQKSKFEKANQESDIQPTAFEIMRQGYVKMTTLSLSFVKLFFPHSCKNIFVHNIEKANLLFRTDNNTGLFTRKILQTTTI